MSTILIILLAWVGPAVLLFGYLLWLVFTNPERARSKRMGGKIHLTGAHSAESANPPRQSQ